MKKGVLITYVFQFLSSLLIVMILIFSLLIVSSVIFKKEYINSKLGSEILASVISSVSSSSFNINLEMPVQETYKIDIKDNKINVTLGTDSFSSPVILPDYVLLKEKSFLSQGKIEIEKINNEVKVS